MVQKDGGLFLPGFLGRFVDVLASKCDEVVCFLHQPRTDERRLLDYRIEMPNVRLVDLGFHTSVPVRTIFSGWYSRKLRNELAELDAVILRGPSPLLPAMASAAAPLPTILYIVGDYLPGIDDLPQPGWRKEAIRIWAKWYNGRQRISAKRSIPLVISRQLYDEFYPITTRTGLVSAASMYADDFYMRGDSCVNLPIRLLYVGRIDAFKGVFDILEAVRHLLDLKLEVVLEIVGWTSEGDNTRARLENYARRLGILDHVLLLGRKPFGPELFRHYREADIFVLAPRGDEGGPRVIWEAMAYSLPVVCTRVGGIPDLLEDSVTALLVPPRNSKAMAEAIDRIVQNGELRRRLIRNGHELARAHTLEALVDAIMAHLRLHANDSG